MAKGAAAAAAAAADPTPASGVTTGAVVVGFAAGSLSGVVHEQSSVAPTAQTTPPHSGLSKATGTPKPKLLLTSRLPVTSVILPGTGTKVSDAPPTRLEESPWTSIAILVSPLGGKTFCSCRPCLSACSTFTSSKRRLDGAKGGNDGGKEGGVDGGKEGGVDGGKEGGVDGGKEGGADGDKGLWGGVEGGAEGGKQGGAAGGARGEGANGGAEGGALGDGN